MSDHSGRFSQTSIKGDADKSMPGFGIAGWVASSAAFLALAGFGAIAVIAGSAPTEIGNIVESPVRNEMRIADLAEESERDAFASIQTGSVNKSSERGAGRQKSETGESLPDTVDNSRKPSSKNTFDRLRDAAASDDSAAEVRASSYQTQDGMPEAETKLENLVSQSSSDMTNDTSVTSAVAPTPRPNRNTVDGNPVTKPQVQKGKTGFARKAVNMRASPDNSGRVLMVIPANGKLVVHGCKGWCDVTYDGKRGFIYKTFLKNG